MHWNSYKLSKFKSKNKRDAHKFRSIKCHMKKCRKHFHLLLHANFDSVRMIATIRVTDHNDLFDGLKIYNKCIVSCGIFLTTAIPILDLEHGFECLPRVLLPIIWITRQKVRIDIDCTHVLAERVFCNQQ